MVSRLVALSVAALLLMVGSAAPATAQSETVQAVVMVNSDPSGTFQATGDTCNILDVSGAVAKMTVQDASSSELLASVTLTGGTINDSPNGDWCSVTWSGDVARSEFYRVTVGSDFGQTFSLEEIRSGSATVVASNASPTATAPPTLPPTAEPVTPTFDDDGTWSVEVFWGSDPFSEFVSYVDQLPVSCEIQTIVDASGVGDMIVLYYRCS